MNDGWRKELIDLLMSAKTRDELGLLMKSLLTPHEYDELVMRWQIVKGLIEGKSQRDIKDELGISIATVTRGSREVKYGDGTFQKFYRRMRSGKKR